MPQIVLALLRSLSGFARPGVWRYLVLPPLIAGFVWVFSTVMWLRPLVAVLLTETPLAWLQSVLGDWHLAWFAKVLAFGGAWIILLAGAYLLAVLISAIWALPALAAHLAATDYADVAARGKGSLLSSLGVTFKATAIYLVGWVATLPLWFLPGMAIAHSLFWLSYLTRATFAFDAIASHVGKDEWLRVNANHRGRFWGLALIVSLLAHLPLIGLFAPSLAAMSYVHYGFEALRAERSGSADGVIEGEVIEVFRE